MSIIELLSDEHVAKLETVALRDATEWQGGGYRLSVLRYADAPDFTSGQGAYLNGSRYSPVGTFPVLYLGDDLDGQLRGTTLSGQVPNHCERL